MKFPHPAGLLALSTASAPHQMRQSDAVQIAERMFEGRFSGWERMRPVFDSAGIDQRPEQHVAGDPGRGVDPGVPTAQRFGLGSHGAAIWAARWPPPGGSRSRNC